MRPNNVSFSSSFTINFINIFALASFGDLIKVDKVKFKTVKDDWLMTEIDISVGRNNSTGSVGKNMSRILGFDYTLGFKNPKIEGGIDLLF